MYSNMVNSKGQVSDYLYAYIFLRMSVSQPIKIFYNRY